MRQARPLAANLSPVLALLPLLGLSGCCGLIFSVKNDDLGLQIQETETEIIFLLDENKVYEPGDTPLYNPKDARFASPPDLSEAKTESEDLRLEVVAVEKAEFSPERELRASTRIARRSVDLGWVIGPIRSADIEQPREITLDGEKTLTASFKLERRSVPMRLYNLPYDEAEDIDDSGQSESWIHAIAPLRRLRVRDVTATTRFWARVPKSALASSGFETAEALGAAIFKRSTPIYASLYTELRERG